MILPKGKIEEMTGSCSYLHHYLGVTYCAYLYSSNFSYEIEVKSSHGSEIVLFETLRRGFIVVIQQILYAYVYTEKIAKRISEDYKVPLK